MVEGADGSMGDFTGDESFREGIWEITTLHGKPTTGGFSQKISDIFLIPLKLLKITRFSHPISHPQNY